MRFDILAISLIASTPGYALDAITYKGTLGRSDIIVELTDPADGMMIGRYSYLHVGGDIPLHNLDGINSFELAEEAPCTEETCFPDEDGLIDKPPIGAHWSLNFTEDQTGLTGQWMQPGGSTKALDVSLREIGRRTLPEGSDVSPFGLANSAFIGIFGNGDTATPATHPYEFAKMDVRKTDGPVQEMDGSQFRFVSDPRSVFAFPKIVSLADGSSPDAANGALAARHAAINVAAFSCLNMAYAGFSHSPYDISMQGGSLGDFDGEIISVGYLSPTVMAWTESGSTWCGGAHPNNHFNSFIIDVKTGGFLALGRVFKHLKATVALGDGTGDGRIDQAAALASPDHYLWAPGEQLVNYVLANHQEEAVEGCEIEDLIATNLGVRFGPGDTAIFALENLPHAIFACTQDVLTVKLADIPELLAPTARDYFPSLAN